MASSSVALRPPHPWPKADHGGVASSLFCFERDPHGLSHPFQKAKLLRNVQQCLHGTKVSGQGWSYEIYL